MSSVSGSNLVAGGNVELYAVYGMAFVMAGVMVAALTPWAKRLGTRRKWVDKPGGRKVHSKSIPRVGGVAVFLGLAAAFAALALASDVALGLMLGNAESFLALAGGCVLLFATGLWDDIRGLSHRVKFALQAGAGLIAFFGGFHFVAFPNGASIIGIPGTGIALSLCLTLLWTVGTTNAINLIDGLDGLASGIAAISMFILGIISEINGHPATAMAAFLAAGAVGGFLVFNRHPASIFLGDSGSLVIGVLVSILTIQGTQQGSLYASLVIPAALVLVPLLDISFAMWRRAQKGLPLSSADDQHIHHRLLRQGIPHRTVVHILWGVSLAAGAFALLIHVVPEGFRYLLVNAFAFVALLAAVRYLGTLEWRSAAGALRAINRRRRTPREKVLELRRDLERLGECASAQGVIQGLARIASDLGLESMLIYMRANDEPEGFIEVMNWNRATRKDEIRDPNERDAVTASKAYTGDPGSSVLVEFARPGWMARRRSEDFQLWANLVADKLSNLGVFGIFCPARTLSYSAIMETT
jgi:UDP-GlcNAc:undecaprenyl-phosphate GlcNAc-1-phosphate transferase